MNLNPNPLESAFEPVKRGNPQDAARQDSEMQNFNDFFARLSTLDDLNLSPQNSVLPTRPASGSAPAMPKSPATPRGATQNGAAQNGAAQGAVAQGGAPAGRMQVMRSHRSVPPENPVPLMPRAGAAAATQPAASAGSRVGTVLRVLLAGLVLFAVGLGAMWGALSLPAQFSHGKNPWLSAATGSGTDAAAANATAVNADAITDDGEAMNAAADAQGLSPDEEAEQDRQDAIAAVASPAPVKAKANSAPKSTEKSTAKITANNTGKTAAMLPGMIAAQAKAPAAANNAAASAAAASTESASDTATGPRYALQVGACGSDACVRKYRALLESSVSPGTIRVVSQESGTGTVQRIRISPLERAEAERIKDTLKQTDPRFKDAYITKLK